MSEAEGRPTRAPDARSSAEVEASATLPRRYQIQARLGRGTAKSVHRAYDVVLQREVAIARLAGPSDDACLDELLAEAQAMARVSAHESIVTIYDVTRHEDVLHLVTEYLPGGSLRDRLAEGPLDQTLALRSMHSLLSALGYAHGRGIVHRDVKPENLLYDEEGNAHLADFGLATSNTRQSSGSGREMAGTPLYMAPEQLHGIASPQSDLYSAGCVLYEMLTGQPPFEGGTIQELMDAVQNRSPEPPRSLVPSIPPTLNRICLKLLEKQPGDRPGSAEQVMEALTGGHRLGAAEARGEETRATGWVDGAARCFVGRDSVLDRIGACLADSTPTIVVVEGAAGIGKSLLLDEAVRRPDARGRRIWRGAAHEGSGFPLGPILDMLLPERDDIQMSVPGSAAVLGSLFEGCPTHQFEAALYRLADVVVEYARQHPLVVAVDDLHWADPASLRVLDHLHSLMGGRGADACLDLIVASRPAPDNSTLYGLVSQWRRSSHVRVEDLSPLPSGDTGAVITALTGMTPGHQLVSLLHETTQGNPLFVRELLRHLDASGQLFDRGGVLVTDAQEDDIGLPVTLTSTLSLLVRRVSPEALASLRTAACFGLGWSARSVAKVAGQTRGDLLDQIGEMERTGLVVGAGDQYVFAHPLIRKTVYDAIVNSDRMRTHSAIARHLLETAQEREVDPIEIAGHAALGLDFGDAGVDTELMIDAAERALGRMAWSEAIRFCEAVLDSADSGVALDEPERLQLHYLAGSGYHQLAQIDRAKQHLEAAAEMARALADPRQLARALQILFRIDTNFGRVDLGGDPGTEELEDLVERLEGREPQLCAEMMVTLSISSDTANRVGESARWIRRGLELARSTGDDGLIAYTATAHAITQWKLLQPRESVDSSREAIAAALRADDPAQQARSLQRLPYAQLMLGDLDGVLECAAQALEASDPILATGETSIPITAALGAELARGRFDRALRLSREGMDVLRQSGYVGVADMLVTASACAAASIGDFGAANETLAVLLEPETVFDNPLPVRNMVERHKRIIRALQGETDAVRAELTSAPPTPARDRINLRRLTSYCATAEAAWESGAREVAGNCYPALRQGTDSGVVLLPGWSFLVPRVCGCVAAMMGDVETAERDLGRALKIAQMGEMQAEIGKTQLAFARLYDSIAPDVTSERIEQHCRQAELVFERARMIPYLQAVVNLRQGYTKG